MALQKKPPVVTIMGHVDHGKTSLLDFIRQSKLAAKEAGEITQAIGAYQINFNRQKITFIDTPGHAAFTNMRSRGASVADLVILVVAANDGVMPQTKESLKIIEKAQVPMIVAINKIDLAQASADKVKAQLAENNVIVEDYGGKVVAVPVSAKTGQGVDQLLEMILLSVEMADLRADPEGRFEAEVIESRADKFCGPLATLIVRNGTLRKKDQIMADGVRAKVKMLRNERGKPLEAAYPGDPAQVLGFEALPAVGAVVVRAEKEKPIPKVVKKRILLPATKETKLKIILKTDTAGSLEAISACLPKEVQIVEKGVGEATESDVLLAKTLRAEVYSFNLPPRANIKKLAQTERVKIKNYNIIYELLEDLEERILKILEPTIDRTVLGKAEILETFEIKGEKIAGARVLEGKINKSAPVCLQRGNKILGETKIVSLKQEKQDVNEVPVKGEFGAVFAEKVDFQKGDMIISYSLEEK
ncbi:MAG TPA: translation initiation factor IF-2 [Clostridia bacterium]|nr:translation initiation factor IF-2 [Clostridia bacterium]